MRDEPEDVQPAPEDEVTDEEQFEIPAGHDVQDYEPTGGTEPVSPPA